MHQVKAHFDGTVFVPEEPVDCPQGTPVWLTVEVAEERPLLALVRAAARFGEDPGWPKDGASQHDHYLYGTRKRG